MGGVILLGSISMGTLLMSGRIWFADNVLMWFASADSGMELWRQGIVAGLLILIIVRQFYDALYLRAVWALLGTLLIWHGAAFFIEHPDYVFDAMLMLSAGVCFALEAVRTGDELIEEQLSRLGYRLHALASRLYGPVRWLPQLLPGLPHFNISLPKIANMANTPRLAYLAYVTQPIVPSMLPMRAEALSPRAVLNSFINHYGARDRFSHLRYLSEIKDDSHRLNLRQPLAH